MGGLCPRPGYQPLPQSHILEICPDNTVRVSTEDNQELVIKVSTEPRPRVSVIISPCVQASYVLVLIGSAADLSFLGDTARRLGVAGPGLAISRTNPVEVDVFTHQTTAVPGLFAMGPLIGDNFVRWVTTQHDMICWLREQPNKGTFKYYVITFWLREQPNKS